MLQPILVLSFSAAFSLYCLCAFAHARLANADVTQLDQLYRERRFRTGSTVTENYRTLARLLDGVAPAVCMRRELWADVYFLLLIVVSVFNSISEKVNSEMRRLVAYQAMRYRSACAQLASLRG